MHTTRFRYWILAALALALGLALTGCFGAPDAPAPTATFGAAAPADPPTSTPLPPQPTDTPAPTGTSTPTPVPVSDRQFVPVLCYHHVREWVKSDTEEDRAYIVPPAKLEAELKYLQENGYHSVVSGQVYEYYANGKPLPNKPVMLSFDDNDDNQYTAALPLLKKYGFTATFFIMTVSIDRPNYMTGDQIIDLDKQGFDVQPHTWDHHMVTDYKTDADWQKQIIGPKKTLEDMLGHPTPYFAYPFGVYDAASAEKLKQYGYKAAFRLRDVQDKAADPLFAIKRYIANSYWTMDQFQLALDGNW
jgi:peptidoglycan/xylan/chitin deacetylase (PgdA/CDA1 family)